MPISLGNAFIKNFLGKAPDWYKLAIISFLIINPIVFFLVNPFVAGWLLVVEFIFTLAMALKCYPLQPGGLLAIEAIAIGMTSPEQVKHELVANIEVLLLLVFMVAGIYFMKHLLLFIFTKILLGIRSKAMLSLAFLLCSRISFGISRCPDGDRCRYQCCRRVLLNLPQSGLWQRGKFRPRSYPR